MRWMLALLLQNARMYRQWLGRAVAIASAVPLAAQAAPQPHGPWTLKVESRLLQLYGAWQQGGLPAAHAFAQRHALPLGADGALTLEARWPAGRPWPPQPPRWLRDAGAALVVRGLDRADVRGSLWQLPILAGNPAIQWLQLPLAPQPMAVQSQGLALAGLQPYHCQGKLGQGRAIAVVDVGFGGWAAAVAAGELPGDVTVPDDNGIAHGSSCAEIAFDLAPAAQIYPAQVQSIAALQSWLAQELPLLPKLVISHSLGWYGESFGDGSGWLCDAIAALGKQGVVWVTAAGNLGAGALWRGPWRDDDGDGWLEFADHVSTNAFAGSAPATAMAVLDWQDYPVTDTDLDLQLCLMTDKGCELAAMAGTKQQGSQPPVEVLSFVLPVSGTYAWRVHLKKGSPLPVQVRLSAVSPAVGPLQFHSKTASLAHPADCAGAVSVGAVDHLLYGTGPVAAYSSHGPTSDGRAKPDLAAPAAVETWQSSVFQGTSAAVPHVAAAIAVYAQASGVGLAEAASAVVALARPLALAPVPDYAAGAGRLYLPFGGSGAACQPGSVAACPDDCGGTGLQVCSEACEYGACSGGELPCTSPADAGGDSGVAGDAAPQAADAAAPDGSGPVAAGAAPPDRDGGWCQSQPSPGRSKATPGLMILAIAAVLARRRR